MSKDILASVQQLFRYPVKSLQGETLKRCKIGKYGLPGDRTHAFVDETRPGKFITCASFPELLFYKAEVIGNKKEDQCYDTKITSQDGRTFNWNDKELLAEIKQLTNRIFSPIQYHPLQTEHAYWEGHVLITTDSSLRKIEQIWGNEIDIRRFRPNIHLSIESDDPFLEESWIGKKISVGSVTFEINKACTRCSYINIDPETLAVDPSLLKLVVNENNNNFGVYATVIESGEVTIGDKISVLN
jgi:uncharacterized protein YcbX